MQISPLKESFFGERVGAKECSLSTFLPKKISCLRLVKKRISALRRARLEGRRQKDINK
jgi:hypothetical protein